MPSKYDDINICNERPVILLAGLANTLALCRSFGRAGINVTVCASRSSPALYSRFCKQRLLPKFSEVNSDFWHRVLIEDPPRKNLGGVLIACNDEAIDFVAKFETVLRDNFILETNPGPVRLALLNKEKSIEIARRAGIDAPRFANVRNLSDVQATLDYMKLPVLVRPIFSHEFTKVFGRKLILCNTIKYVEQISKKAFDANVEIMLCEFVPGDDDRLCSYYTYMDQFGKPMFAFTKRVLRKDPYNFGEGSYHVTEWLPEVANLGQKFFDEAGLRGLGNIEFKRDPRDDKLKFIECNARFTAAHELFVKCEYDIGLFVYGQLTGVPYQLPEKYTDGVRMSIAYRDLKAYRYLSKNGYLNFRTWIRETVGAEARPYFQWTDPLPLFGRIDQGIKETFQLFRSIISNLRLLRPSRGETN